MRKENLKGGNVVVFRNGDKGLIIKNPDTNSSLTFRIVDINKGFVVAHLGEYDENLISTFNNKHDYDIIKVYKDYTFKELLWTNELTYEERIILKNIDTKYKYIVKQTNSLILCRDKPFKAHDCWNYKDLAVSFNEFNHLFKFIKNEDENPYLISSLIGGEN